MTDAPNAELATAPEVGADVTWYFTYGSNHLDRNGISLGQCYTPIIIPDATSYADRGWAKAREIVFNVRGEKWSMQYDHPLECGIERHSLVERSLDEVTTVAVIDNTAEAEKRIKWKRENLLMQLAALETTVKIIARLPLNLIEKCSPYDAGLDVDHLSRTESIEAMRILNGGKWAKTVNSGSSTALDYTTEIDGIRVRLYAAAAPETCRVVEYEETIPAQVVKRRKLICTPTEPSHEPA